MNTFLPTHPARGKFFGFLPGTLALLLCAASAQADFSGAFILTPPPNGSYANSPTLSAFGGWFLTTPGSGDFWVVDTGTAPTNLSLSVLDLVGVNAGPTALTFTTAILPFAGTIDFDFIAAYGFNSPQIAFQLSGTDIPGYINPVSGHATISFLVGDTIGFRLSAITDESIASQAQLTVFNLVPEPTTGALAALGVGLLGFGLRKRRV